MSLKSIACYNVCSLCERTWQKLFKFSLSVELHCTQRPSQMPSTKGTHEPMAPNHGMKRQAMPTTIPNTAMALPYFFPMPQHKGRETKTIIKMPTAMPAIEPAQRDAA